MQRREVARQGRIGGEAEERSQGRGRAHRGGARRGRGGGGRGSPRAADAEEEVRHWRAARQSSSTGRPRAADGVDLSRAGQRGVVVFSFAAPRHGGPRQRRCVGAREGGRSGRGRAAEEVRWHLRARLNPRGGRGRTRPRAARRRSARWRAAAPENRGARLRRRIGQGFARGRGPAASI